MSDHLKLADLDGGADEDRIVMALEQEENNKLIQELENNIALLEKELERKRQDSRKSVKAKNNKIGARKNEAFKAISTAPSINKTPIGPSMVPIPYQTIQDLANSVDTARSVKFNGNAAKLLDCST